MKTKTSQDFQRLLDIIANQELQSKIRAKRKIKNALVILAMPVGYILAMLGGKVINTFFTGFWKWAIGIILVIVLMFILLKLMSRYWNPEDSGTGTGK